MVRMALNHIIPAAILYKTAILKEVALSKEVYGDLEHCSTELSLLSDLTRRIDEVRTKATEMREARKKANSITDDYERALGYHEIAESFPALRRPIDKLEEIVDIRLWPLPKYRELLFIS